MDSGVRDSRKREGYIYRKRAHGVTTIELPFKYKGEKNYFRKLGNDFAIALAGDEIKKSFVIDGVQHYIIKKPQND